MTDSLWGEEFNLPSSPKKVKKIAEKIAKPKSTSDILNKSIKSKKVSIDEKIATIRENVYRILGKYKDDTICIRTKEDLRAYFDAAIENKIISIDTETDNSLDPLTCKLMGPCIYTPGQKNAYIPMHHIDKDTRELLPNQLTEQDFKEELDRLTNVFIVMHNGKFDYQVIKCTTGKELTVNWDTMIAAKLLNENESAKLKDLYIKYIDPSIEKYSIDHLFEKMEYAIFEPELFALYAATDAFMTYKLYLWQLEQLSKPEHAALLNLLNTVEMPVMKVAAEMELTGICIDEAYSKRLSVKYHKMLDEINNKIDEELSNYSQKISDWRLTEEANFHPKSKKPDKNGEYKLQKSKNEQLSDPPELSSPTQLAILLYDVLKTPVIDKKTPRGTGEDILSKIKLPLCELILEKRGLDKLIGTYIDKLPACLSEKDNRLHAHFNQLGAGTGRFSSSEPNLQNIPSHNKAIRMMFCASDNYMLVGSDFSLQKVG